MNLNEIKFNDRNLKINLSLQVEYILRIIQLTNHQENDF
jgi:hypothetical protein